MSKPLVGGLVDSGHGTYADSRRLKPGLTATQGPKKITHWVGVEFAETVNPLSSVPLRHRANRER